MKSLNNYLSSRTNGRATAHLHQLSTTLRRGPATIAGDSETTINLSRLSMTTNFGEYSLRGATPDGGCNAILVLSLDCPVCRNAITPPSLCLGSPYWCLVHERCVKLFPFNGDYPHPFPISVMMSVSSSHGSAQESSRALSRTEEWRLR